MTRPASCAALGDHVVNLTAFHVLTTVSALAMAVFGLGLARRLKAALPADSLLPALAAFGLLGTSVVQIIGTGLDTEFIVGVASPEVTTPAPPCSTTTGSARSRGTWCSSA